MVSLVSKGKPSPEAVSIRGKPEFIEDTPQCVLLLKPKIQGRFIVTDSKNNSELPALIFEMLLYIYLAWRI